MGKDRGVFYSFTLGRFVARNGHANSFRAYNSYSKCFALGLFRDLITKKEKRITKFPARPSPAR